MSSQGWDQGPLYQREDPGQVLDAPRDRAAALRIPAPAPAAELEAEGQIRLKLGPAAYGARCRICGGAHQQSECPRAARMFDPDPPTRGRRGRSAGASRPRTS